MASKIRIALGALGFLVYTWVEAVLLAPRVRKRKRARRARQR